MGPLIGGILTDGLGWQWIFFVNIPIGVATIAISLTRMVNVRDPDAERLDWAGLVTFSGALFLLIFGLLRGTDEGWGSTLIVSVLAGAVVLLAAFLVVELRQRRPMFDLSLFSNRAFCGVSLATFADRRRHVRDVPLSDALPAERARLLAACRAACGCCRATILTFIVPLLTRGLAGRWPPGVLLGAGLGLTALGLVADARRHRSLAAGPSCSPACCSSGVGIGLANPAIANIALGVVSPERSGMASGISNTFRIGGLAVGVAALGAVFEHRIDDEPAGVAGRDPAGARTRPWPQAARARRRHWRTGARASSRLRCAPSPTG